MKKDWFNGKIRSEYVDWIKATLIIVSLVCFIIATACLCMLIFGKNETKAIYISFSALTFISYLFSFLYPFVSLKVIRNYPKHKHIAHALIKKFVFNDYEDLAKEILGKNSIEISSWQLYDNILRYIYSNEINKYLRKNADKLSLQQWATLVLEFWKGKKVGIFEQLRDVASSDYEKNLFDIALKDIRKFGDVGERTISFYEKNDSRGKNKPNLPFSEKIELPILFEYGDIVTFENNLDEYYLIGRKPIITDCEDISDYSYLCYQVNVPIHNAEELFLNHVHLSVCSINKVDVKKLPKNIQNNISNVMKIIEDNGNCLLK